MASPHLSLSDRGHRLDGIAHRVAPVSFAGDQTMPVLDALVPLFPRGTLQRGTVVAAAGSGGALSLAVATCAAASAAGCWVAVLGADRLGLAAVEESGVALDRLVVVEPPEPGQWGAVAAALVDAFDLVLIVTRHRVDAGQARRLRARARERGSVIVQVGRWGWPQAPDVRLDVIECNWDGLGLGHGVLQARRLTVTAVARRDARPRRKLTLWLPDLHGRISDAARPSETWAGSDIELVAAAGSSPVGPGLLEAG